MKNTQYLIDEKISNTHPLISRGLLKQGYLSQKDTEISVLVYHPEHIDSSKLAIVQHGRNGRADAPHMLPVIQSYVNNGYMVVAPNASNSEFNDSDGEPHEFTISQHIADVARAIEWTKEHADYLEWDGRTFAMAGHSMGGFATPFLAATVYNAETRHVLAISPVASGEAQIKLRRSQPHELEYLENNVPLAMQEWPLHNIYPVIRNLHMPVGVIVGAQDSLTTPEHATEFYLRLPNPAGLDIIPEKHHCILDPGFSEVVCNRIANIDYPSLQRKITAPTFA